MDIKSMISSASSEKILYTRHALDQMLKPDRQISPEEIESVVSDGIIIEDYPEDNRGHSCLVGAKVVGKFGSRTIHVVCAPNEDYLTIVTAYVPNEGDWDQTLMKRRRP